MYKQIHLQVQWHSFPACIWWCCLEVVKTYLYKNCQEIFRHSDMKNDSHFVVGTLMKKNHIRTKMFDYYTVNNVRQWLRSNSDKHISTVFIHQCSSVQPGSRCSRTFPCKLICIHPKKKGTTWGWRTFDVCIVQNSRYTLLQPSPVKREEANQDIKAITRCWWQSRHRN